MTTQSFFHTQDLLKARSESGRRYKEFLRVPAMSAGMYVLEAGEEDTQKPHTEDELYYVVSGRACMKAGNEDQVVEAGSLIFVPANQSHKFYDIRERLEVLVFFAPAEND